MWVIDVLLSHFQECTDKIKTLLTKKSKFHFVQYLKQNGTMYWGSGSERVFFNFKIIQTISINKYTEPFFLNLNIYAHLCGHLLTLICPFIILYALFFIKHKNLWIKNLISWENFATLIYSKLQEPV